LGNDEDLFCVQHACKCDQEGYLYLYNNGCDPDGPSSVVMLKQPLTKDGQPRITWEYECGNPHIQVPLSQKAGGNVIELPHKAMFISMGMQYGEVFIVSHDKKIQWGASPETFDPIQKSWHPKPSYRASIITNHKDIEQLIWNAQK